MRILVGILYSGENEISKCIESLASQQSCQINSFVIENMPNKQAHDTLYSRFMQESGDHDIFLKLDADMILKSPFAVKEMAALFNPDVAHLMSYVHDGPSGLKIPGIQMYRSNTVWEGSVDQLNVDYPPKILGRSILKMDSDWVDHMPDPNDHQLFRYGIHKALKAIQPDRSAKNLRKGLLHISILNGIARAYFSGKARNIWSLIGAELVFTGYFRRLDYNGEVATKIYRKLQTSQVDFDKYSLMASVNWKNEIQNNFRWAALVESSFV